VSDLDRDRRWCRAILPRVSRTFALNIRWLSGSFRDAVECAYLWCRAADALEDSWPGEAARIEERFAWLRDAIDGDDRAAERLASGAAPLRDRGSDLDLVAGLPALARVFRGIDAADRGPITRAVHVMATGMARYSARATRRDPAHAYLDDERELLDYCWVVAGCVGVMLTELHARRFPADAATSARRLELAPIVGRSLQLTNILLDWPHDVRRGRCYVPGAWLAEFGLAPADLVGAPRPELAELVARLERLARGALARVPDYVATISPRVRRYRLFVLLPSLWALRSIERAHREPEFPWGETRPKLTRGELWSASAAAMLGDSPVEELRTCASGLEPAAVPTGAVGDRALGGS